MGLILLIVLALLLLGALTPASTAAQVAPRPGATSNSARPGGCKHAVAARLMAAELRTN